MVATPIVRIVVTSTALRPIRSPKCPKMTPPSGRARYPTASVPNEAICPAAESRALKKSWLNTSAAAVPYSMKSYHSTTDPMKLETRTRFAARRFSAAVRPPRLAVAGAGLAVGESEDVMLAPPVVRLALVQGFLYMVQLHLAG